MYNKNILKYAQIVETSSNYRIPDIDGHSSMYSISMLIQIYATVNTITI